MTKPTDIADNLEELKPFLEAHHCRTDVIDEAVRELRRREPTQGEAIAIAEKLDDAIAVLGGPDSHHLVKNERLMLEAAQVIRELVEEVAKVCAIIDATEDTGFEPHFEQLLMDWRDRQRPLPSPPSETVG